MDDTTEMLRMIRERYTPFPSIFSPLPLSLMYRDIAPQPFLQVVPADEPPTDVETDVPRSASATSSLDPYYFGVHTPSESPIPPVPPVPSVPKTPEMRHYEPVTPGRDPAAIDRRILVGVGELATPRWARGVRNDEYEFATQERVDEVNEEELIEVGGLEDERNSDSPWTIEAIDGEQDDKTEVRTLILGHLAIR